MPDPINVSDFEKVARERMDPAAYDYYAGGANDERTVADNLRAFERWAIRPRMLVGVSEADTSTTVLGLPLTLPVVLALYVAIMLVQGLLLMTQSLVNLSLESRISTRLREDLYDAILHADWHFLTRQRGSDLAHAMTSEIDRTGPLTLQLLSTMTTATQIAVALVVAARIAPIATAAVSVIGFVVALALRSSTARADRLGREYLLATLDHHRWQQGAVADILGINRRTIYRKLKQYREEGLLPVMAG